MQQKPMIITTQHSLIVNPQILELTVNYTRFFIHVTRKKLNDHQCELDRYQEHVVDGQRPDIDQHLITLQRELSRAELVLPDLEHLQKELVRYYDINFKTIAEVLRRVRVHLQVDDIYTMYSLRVVVETFAQVLKEGNARFNREKFDTAINGKREEEQ
jgi:hypothetical protein